MTPVVIEASPALNGQAGLGRYTEGLINGLLALDAAGDYRLAYNRAATTTVPEGWQHLTTYTSNLGNKPWRLRQAATYFGLPPMDGFFGAAGVYHSTGHLLPRLTRMRAVFTLHDLIPLIYPEYHLPLNRIFLEQMFPRFLQEADAIIAVSEHSKRDAMRLLSVPAEKITVIPEGVEARFRPVTDGATLAGVKARLGLPERYVLIVCTIEPRKNHITLLRAWERIAPELPDVALVIAGKAGWLYEDFFKALEESPVRGRVVVTGRVADEDLIPLLSGAEVFAFPSLYEGFGLPPLEAMACGAPVVCAETSSLPEAVGAAGVLLPAEDVAAWASTLLWLLNDVEERARLREAGLRHAARFTWAAAAAATRAVYQRV